MGQSASSEPFSHSYSPQHVHTLLSYACQSLITPLESQTLRKKLNSTTVNEKAQLSRADLAQLLLLTDPPSQVVYTCLQKVGKFPVSGEEIHSTITADELIVASMLLSGRFKKLKLSTDYDKLIFRALASSGSALVTEKVQQIPLSVKFSRGFENKENLQLASRFVDWSSMLGLESVDTDGYWIARSEMELLLALFLVFYSIPKRKRSLMQTELRQKLNGQWNSFKDAGEQLTKFIRSTDNISYQDFSLALALLSPLIHYGFEFLVDVMLSDTEPEQEPPQETAVSTEDTTKSHLINSPTIALLAATFAGLGGKLGTISLTRQNLVKLYLGSESGFSIRSLELKVFKWHAPTIMLVSGKRLRTTNKRYETFDLEYPRFFRSLENPLKPWQAPGDKVTYAVLVHEPWKVSNKKNFGDSNTTIIALKPRMDVFKGVAPESIYFNTLGMGLGFGNSQPINKNNLKRYAPGHVSLTIEANLEYAVFRHISSQAGSGTTSFATGVQPEISGHDYEDRFLITDLEVWGVGSSKELEEQKKQWDWEKKQAEARQSVNLRSMGEDRALLEMVGLVGNHGSGGSV